VKARVSPRTGNVTYWEHEALGYRFDKFGETWGLLLEPGYVFTFDGRKGLLAPERVNRLSTKRAARDYNATVLQDLSFWSWCLSDGGTSFALDLSWPSPRPSISGEADASTDDDRWSDVLAMQAERAQADGGEVAGWPRILLSARLPTVTVNDLDLAPGEADEPTREDELKALDAELEELAEETRLQAAADEGDEPETEEADDADQS